MRLKQLSKQDWRAERAARWAQSIEEEFLGDGLDTIPDSLDMCAGMNSQTEADFLQGYRHPNRATKNDYQRKGQAWSRRLEKHKHRRIGQHKQPTEIQDVTSQAPETPATPTEIPALAPLMDNHSNLTNVLTSV